MATVVEDKYLLLQYATKQTGRPAKGSTNHLRGNVDCIVISHNRATDGEGLTCNPPVAVDDVYGRDNNSGPIPTALPIMSNVPHAGADTDTPDRGAAISHKQIRFVSVCITTLSMTGWSGFRHVYRSQGNRRISQLRIF